MKILTLLLTGLFLASNAAANSKIYTTHLIKRNYEDYMEMLDGRDPLSIKDIASVAASRMTIEPLILQIAPVLGGCDCTISYLPYEEHTPHARTIEQVRNGFDITHGIAGFTDDSRYTEGIMMSEPILAPEEFYVGFYTHDQREEILGITDVEAIRKLRFAVGRSWEIDNKVLSENALRVVGADSWDNLIFMIVNNRADVVLQPFIAGNDLAFYDIYSDSTFVPIPNFRMLFGQGRHYIVSKRHPDGEEFMAALNRGLKILREDGTLRRAMIYAGVINEQTESFKEVTFD